VLTETEFTSKSTLGSGSLPVGATVAVSKWLSNANSRLRFVIPDECRDEPLDFRTILPGRKAIVHVKVADTEHKCTLEGELFVEFKALRSSFRSGITTRAKCNRLN
jgi:hypothetical protein